MLLVIPEQACVPHYIPMMNCIFAAQSQKIVVDVVAICPPADAIGSSVSELPRGIFQQLASFTGGLFLPIAQVSLMPHLLAVRPSP